ncbi:anaerobic ribonucleoside-triphosphate reductase [Roseburia inulinivorans]|uniref:anaerobic ribonucleoside-triphosphate reductase n=1 Tax=Roseburia inulinivorans TaxID=360807 RepID=UPI0032C04324
MTKVKVIQRDCSEADFDKSKISTAILKAMKNGSGIIKPKIAEDIADEIEEECKDKDEVSVSDIESMVYDKLITKKQRLTAKAYEGYRSIREFQRENENTTDSEIDELLDGESEYWNTENSNKNSKVLNTQRDYMAGIVSKDISRRFLLPPEVVQAHDEGIIHFHDIDYFGMNAMSNCSLINLEDMLQNGTCINKVMIEKPHRFITACTIATQIILGVTSLQYGGATITLTHLAPFVRDSYNKYYEKYKSWGFSDENCKRYAESDTKKEVADGVQTFNYQCNSMSNSNGQSPFLSVFMYLGETTEYKKELAMIIEEFLNQRLLGLKNEVGVYVTQAFPKLLYVLEEDNIHENSPYWYLTKLAAKCTAKRMNPDYISEKIMKKYKEGNCFPCMGCRSFLSPYKDENGNYKFYGRLNQGVVTLNLVDVALSSEGDYEKFWDLMEQRTELCHKALLCRHKRLEGTLSDVAPLLWQYGAFARLEKGEKIDRLLHNGYASISLGYAGLYECVKYMTGKSHIDSQEGHDFGIKVMQFMNDKCDQWNKEHYIGFSIYGSPIENTTYKFAKCLQKRFGIIKGITDRNYITNSYHTFVKEQINAFDKLAKESEFQALSLGGAISYVETDGLVNNVDAILEMNKFIYDHIMYAEENTKSDYCQICGYDGEIKIIDEGGELIWECPNCHNRDKDKMNVARRTCGYIGTNYWGKGRTQEIKERYVHMTDIAEDL